MGWADALQGAGAWLQGSGPQYMQAQALQDEARAKHEAERQKAMLTDFVMAESMLKNGQVQPAIAMFRSRVEAGKKLPPIQSLGGSMGTSEHYLGLLESGNIDQAFKEIATGNQVLRDAGVLPGQSTNPIQFGASSMGKDEAGNLWQITQARNPNTGKAETVMSPVGHSNPQVGGIQIVGTMGMTPGESIDYRGTASSAESIAREAAAAAYAAEQARNAATGANQGAAGFGGGPSNADLAAERAAAEARAKAEAESKARTVKAAQIYTPFSTQLTALRDAYKGTGTGPLVGRFSGYTSSSQKALAARDIMSPMLKQVVRDAGEGTFAKNDQDQIDAMMPKETDLPEVVDYKIGLMDTFVRGKLGVPLDTPSPVNQNANPMEGKTAVNPQTGEKIIMRNGQWVPM